MPTMEEYRARAARFSKVAAKLGDAKKAGDARHYRKLAKRMQRRARLIKAQMPKPAAPAAEAKS